ncbi:MAG: hypothetical protein Q4C27_05725, partial [Eubacteriales bacterium]|nr:hypothetical protein [Eubacteriales bacterium]
MASAIRRFIGTSPFLPPDPAVIRMIIPDTAPKISNDKKSLNSRHILPPSFLFRRKEAKENHLRSSHSLRSSRFRQPVTQNGRFTYEPSSFLFRRKEAKENQRRESGFSALQPLSPTCNTKRTVHIRTVRFSLPNRTCGKTSFLRKTSSPAVSFVSFLQEKKSFPQRAPSYLPKMRFSSDGGSVAFGTKAGAAVASD